MAVHGNDRWEIGGGMTSTDKLIVSQYCVVCKKETGMEKREDTIEINGLRHTTYIYQCTVCKRIYWYGY